MPDINPVDPKDGSKDKDTNGGTPTDGNTDNTQKTDDPTNPDGDSGGMGAGWVILILLIIFGGLAGVWKVFGEQIKDRLNGTGGGTFQA